MTVAESKQLECGVYRIYWKDGSKSVGAIGMLANGSRWFAPANWIQPAVEKRPWRLIQRVELIEAAR